MVRSCRSYLILAVVAMMLAVAGVAIAATTGGSPTTFSQYEAGQRAQLASAPDVAQTEAFSILRRARTSADALPAQLSLVLASSGHFTGVFGANVALSRRVNGLGSTGSAWVVPGSGALCVYATINTDPSAPQAGAPSGGVCQPDDGATQGDLYVESESDMAPGMDFVAGLVPDGVSTVTLDLADGTHQSVAVTENLYMAEIKGHIATIKFDTASQRVVFTL